MRQTILAAVAAFVIGGAATGAVVSQAQPAPPPPGPEADGGPAAHHWAGDGGPHRFGHWGHHHGLMRTFALIYRQEDRALAPADVQKIVEGFLLWNGNHTWKVANVAATSDGEIGFTLTTQEGSTVARFTIDPHTARITRVG